MEIKEAIPGSLLVNGCVGKVAVGSQPIAETVHPSYSPPSPSPALKRAGDPFPAGWTKRFLKKSPVQTVLNLAPSASVVSALTIQHSDHHVQVASRQTANMFKYPPWVLNILLTAQTQHPLDKTIQSHFPYRKTSNSAEIRWLKSTGVVRSATTCDPYSLRSSWVAIEIYA